MLMGRTWDGVPSLIENRKMQSQISEIVTAHYETGSVPSEYPTLSDTAQKSLENQGFFVIYRLTKSIAAR